MAPGLGGGIDGGIEADEDSRVGDSVLIDERESRLCQDGDGWELCGPTLAPSTRVASANDESNGGPQQPYADAAVSRAEVHACSGLDCVDGLLSLSIVVQGKTVQDKLDRRRALPTRSTRSLPKNSLGVSSTRTKLHHILKGRAMPTP